MQGPAAVVPTWQMPQALKCCASLPAAVDGKAQFSMLGLGDIVIPGIFVAIVLRYEAAHGFKGSRYFYR